MITIRIKKYLSLYLILGVVVCLFSTELLAQSKLTSPLESFDKMNTNNNSIMFSETNTNDVFPVGNVIYPEAYFVGPNDLLSIQVLPAEAFATPTYVTSENTIVSPRFGELNVNGLTLKDVRDTITKIITSRSANASVNVSLLKPRNVIVTIRGNVIMPGTYTLPASYSVATAIKMANQIRTTTSGTTSIDEQNAALRLQEQERERERTFSETGVPVNTTYSTRNIRIVRSNGKASIVDIERANATSNPIYNPLICEGDDIFVPFENETDYPTISIVGEVLRPITVVYKKGDKLSDLLKMGYALTEYADLESIYLYDENINASKIKTDSACNLLSEDKLLTPGSVVIVGTMHDKQYTHTGVVSVKGEVNNPNIYVIKPGITRLKDVIDQAGGFTDKAYLPRSYIGRRDNQQNERVAPKRLYMEYFQLSDLTMEDTTRFLMDIDLKRTTVSCDFDAAFNKNSEPDNIVLQDGDVIFVSNNKAKVIVFGQVKNPGVIEYVPNKTIEWYIDQAGGCAAGAKIKRARIIRSNTKVWEEGVDETVVVNAGDEIYVPRAPDIPPSLELQKWAAISGMLGTLAGIISLIVSAIK